MFGTVARGPKITRFRIEYTLRNGCQIYEVIQMSNDQLDTSEFNLYGDILDRLVLKLQSRINQRIG